MGRPTEYSAKRVSTAIRFPAEIYRRLRAEAETRQVSINRVVVWAVEDWLRDHVGR